jgi:hypothetical protein
MPWKRMLACITGSVNEALYDHLKRLEKARSRQFELFSVRSSLLYQQNGVYHETSNQTFRCGRGRRQH